MGWSDAPHHKPYPYDGAKMVERISPWRRRASPGAAVHRVRRRDSIVDLPRDYLGYPGTRRGHAYIGFRCVKPLVERCH